MGVLTKLFRRNHFFQQPHRASAASPAAEVEHKPVNTSPGQHDVDQAARLREAVQAAGNPRTEDSDESLDTADSPDLNDTAPDEHLDDLDIDLADRHDQSPETTQSIIRKPKGPKNKQELLEELQRNYHEMVGLIRKFDTHLDQASSRSERIAQVAEQYAELGPKISALPDRMADRVAEGMQAVGTDLRQTIEQQGGASRELLERIESAILQVGSDIERSASQQAQLVETMTEFREGLSEVSRSTTAVTNAVRDVEQHASGRDKAMIQQIKSTRQWLIGLTIGVAIIAIAAVVISIIALQGVAPR